MRRRAGRVVHHGVAVVGLTVLVAAAKVYSVAAIVFSLAMITTKTGTTAKAATLCSFDKANVQDTGDPQ